MTQPPPAPNSYRAPDGPNFNASYTGTPPWDIGRPQAELIRLAESGEIRGTVLDVGCGTGEHVLNLARRGFEAWGVDSAPLAIDKARDKSAQRGIPATFVVADAFDLRALQRTFDTVIDSGLFHIFAPEQRVCFVASLVDVLSPGGTYLMLGYSDQDPGRGPPGFSPDDIDRVFAHDWRINYVREARFEIHEIPGHKNQGWVVSATRL